MLKNKIKINYEQFKGNLFKKSHSNWAICGGPPPGFNDKTIDHHPEFWPGFRIHGRYYGAKDFTDEQNKTIIDISTSINDYLKKDCTDKLYELLNNTHIKAPFKVASLFKSDKRIAEIIRLCGSGKHTFSVYPNEYADQIIAYDGINSSILNSNTKLNYLINLIDNDNQSFLIKLRSSYTFKLKTIFLSKEKIKYNEHIQQLIKRSYDMINNTPYLLWVNNSTKRRKSISDITHWYIQKIKDNNYIKESDKICKISNNVLSVNTDYSIMLGNLSNPNINRIILANHRMGYYD